MGTPLTDAEWNSISFDFPNLTRNDCRKTGAATPFSGPPPWYNCIAWSLLITNSWINPPPSLPVFILLYNLFGYQQCQYNEAIVEGWANATPVMTHGSRYDGQWSSKLGQNIRITHPRRGLVGPLYGDVVVYFRPANPSASAENVASITMSELDAAAASQVTDLAHQLRQRFSTLDDRFETNWRAWTSTFNDTKRLNMQSSSAFATGSEWDALVAMGPSILPQIVNKLQQEQNIFGCELYNKLQTLPNKKVDPKNLQQYYVLNNQAKEIVKLYSSQLAEFNQLAADWAASQQAMMNSSNSRDYTSGPAYEALRGMGSPAIPLIMNRYAEQQGGGFWSELLHEIVHGTPSNTQVFDFDALYRQWADWFQGGQAVQAA